MAITNSGEILFVKSVKDGIPNRDPLAESDARRLFGEADGRISLSDVSIKRDVRDYVLDRYPDGGPGKDRFVFIHELRNEAGKLLRRNEVAESIQKRAGLQDTENMQEVLCKAAFDVRAFGAVYSVRSESFNLTGPTQFAWAHSLHPVESQYVQGTVVLPSDEGKGQGTIWSSYMVPFAVFAMYGVINHALARKTGMTSEDRELVLESLWKGTQHRQARGRGIQQPLMLVHIEYKDPFFRIGYLDEKVAIVPDAEEWRRDNKPTAIRDIGLCVEQLASVIETHAGEIERCRIWFHPELEVIGDIPGEMGAPW